jgi:amino acid adenylation domain-containing protein
LSDVAGRLASLSSEKRAVLEKLLRQKGLAAPGSSIPRRAPGDGPPPVSFGQHRLWFMHRLDPGSSVYNVHTSLDVSSFPPDIVRQAIGEIVRRHGILRTVFREENGEVVQVALPAIDLQIPFVDLCASPDDEREEVLAGWSDDMAHHPFDLQRGPLVRATIVQLEPDERWLLVAMHHAVTDGWSMDVFNRELQTLGVAFAAGRPSPLAPLPIQYGDFSAWQRGRLQGAELEQQLAWWKQTLEGAPPVLELPTDRPRPAAQSDAGAFQAALLGPGPSAHLRELARREGTTLFNVLLTAFKVMLHRYTGQHDIVVGLPVGGRTRAELEPLIGFFVNTLVLRTDVSGDPPFTELVTRVRKTTTDALAHQDLPFEQLVAAIAPDRHLSRAPLFQVMVQLLGSDTLAKDHEDGPTEPGEVEPGTSLFDLSIDFTDGASGIRSVIQYSTDLFEDETITRLLRNWRVLLEAAAGDPDQRISRLPVMTAAERRYVVETCNDTGVEFPHVRSVAALFEQQVERSPDAVAVVGEHESLTYRELHNRARRLAAVLAHAGVRPEAIVGIFMDRTPSLVVAMLAVLEAGGAYVPIDPSTPPDRVQYILDDTRAVVVLTQSWLVSRLPEERCLTVCLDQDPLPAPSADARRLEPASESTLAYVVYTSGSTGRPKGVMITHAAVLNFARGAIGVYGFGPSDRVLQFASIAFDTSVEEILGTLLTGGRLVLRTAAMMESIERFLAECGALGVTVLDPPTAFWHLVVQELVAGTVRLPPSIRLVIFGSERALPERLLDWDQAVGRRVRLMHGYGPTETTVVATIADLTTPVDGRPVRREVSIGRPVPNTYVHIVDSYGQPVPLGVQGEALIGGAQVARGYLNQPETTARAFVDDPFDTGRRLYRTGDRVSRLPNGELLFHGRVDDQIKIRGFRVEPGEIESVLSQHPAVQGCAVVGAPARSGGLQLIAYVVAGDANTVGPSELRAFLESGLPAFMVPSAFVMVAELPLTVTGKVDRNRLAEIRPQEVRTVRTSRAPQSNVERQVAAVWSFVLSTADVGLDDDFFQLGGHSLLALQIVGRLRAEFGIDVPLRALFEHPRLEDFARAVAEAPATAPGSVFDTLAPVPRERFRARLEHGALIVPDALRQVLREYA